MLFFEYLWILDCLLDRTRHFKDTAIGIPVTKQLIEKIIVAALAVCILANQMKNSLRSGSITRMLRKTK